MQISTFHRLLFACLAICTFSLSHAQQTLRVTTIPEEAATEQIRKFGPLSRYLEKSLGTKVEFTPVSPVIIFNRREKSISISSIIA